ncbi:MAG: TetR family transcriptional regulator [Candidatus Nanopelagicales bacterium]
MSENLSLVKPVSELPRRRRSERALLNDAAIRQSTIDLISEEGWDGVTFAKVAKRANLTVGAVYVRAENTAELGTDLWINTLQPYLRDAISALLSSVYSKNLNRIAEQIEAWDNPEPELISSIEILIAAIFDEDLAEIPKRDMKEIFGNYCSKKYGYNKMQAAANSLIIGEALGRALGAANGIPPDTPPSEVAENCLAMIESTPIEAKIPKNVFLSAAKADTDPDPHTRVLHQATLKVIGKVGYKRATIARICRTAHVSSGSLFPRFETKSALIASAVKALIPSAEDSYAQLEVFSEKYGKIEANYIAFLSVFQNLSEEQRKLFLELTRIEIHEPDLSEIDFAKTSKRHFTLGMSLISIYFPEISKLDFYPAIHWAYINHWKIHHS